jgi:hypothetical protein
MRIAMHRKAFFPLDISMVGIAMTIVLVLLLLVLLYLASPLWFVFEDSARGLGERSERYSTAPEGDAALTGPLLCGMGPYHLQIYDAPHYYPYYKGSHQVYWDFNGKCGVWCAPTPGDPEKKCTVWCR